MACQNTGSKIAGPVIITGAVLILVWLFGGPVAARDAGQWDATDPAVREWYQDLKMPDIPTASCCSESDAYYADEVHVRDGKVYATITDDRPDEPRHRPHRESGETFEVPPHKMNKDPNPTGHNIIFLSSSGFVYCFVSGTGI